MSRNNIIAMREVHASSWMRFKNYAARRVHTVGERWMKNTELIRQARAASFKIIALIYGEKWCSWLKRERVFKMRERQWSCLALSWAYAGKPRPRSRSSSFLPVYRSHAAMSNVVKIPLLHAISYSRFPQHRPIPLATLASRQSAELSRKLILSRRKLTSSNPYDSIAHVTND